MSWAFDKPKHGAALGKTSGSMWHSEFVKLASKDPFATEHEQHVSEAQQSVTETYIGSEDQKAPGSYKNVWESAADNGPFGGSAIWADSGASAGDSGFAGFSYGE